MSESFDLESEDNSSKELQVELQPKNKNLIHSKKISMITNLAKPNQPILDLIQMRNNQQRTPISSMRKMGSNPNIFNKFSLANKNFGVRMSNIQFDKASIYGKWFGFVVKWLGQHSSRSAINANHYGFMDGMKQNSLKRFEGNSIYGKLFG
jgi:hypothetical protein